MVAPVPPGPQLRLSATQVLGFINGAGASGNGHQYSDAMLLFAGLLPNEVTRLKQMMAARAKGNPQYSGVWIADGELMTEIAFIESGFYPKAHNPIPPDNSYGLWQINMIGGLGPARRDKYNLKANDELYDPKTNARVAWDLVAKGKDGADNQPPPIAFRAWAPSWQKALRHIANGSAALPTGSVGEGSAVPGAGSTDTTIPDVRGLISTVGDFLRLITDPTWWKRIGIGVLGALVIVGALVLYNAPTIEEGVGKVA